MANIALRNPQFKFHTIPSTGVLSTKATITIGGVLRYTIIKNNPDTLTGFNIDISELARDYLNISYSTSKDVDTIAVITVIQNYSLINAAGSTVGSATTYTDTGFEAYGIYIEGSNPTVPFRGVSTWLLSSETQGTSATDTFQVFLPNDVEGKVVGMNSSGVAVVHTISSTDTVVNVNDITPTLQVARIDCTKYGIGTQIEFINKYGVQQDLWFFLKKVDTQDRTNENYKRNTLEYDETEVASYDTDVAARAIFNTQGRRKITLNSGYYPETAVPYFEQLLYSEYVWINLKKVENGAGTAIPFIVKNSNIKVKTSVNDRLINYTIDFEEAADYINNIR
tara:strand:- start:519 stop:1532 length:1014 start_codon:yes stop_codon:yes gene_type:complete